MALAALFVPSREPAEQNMTSENQAVIPRDDAALREWAERLGVTLDQLKRAIAAEGDDTVAVEAYIKSGHNEAG
jgi:hypothetical protein